MNTIRSLIIPQLEVMSKFILSNQVLGNDDTMMNGLLRTGIKERRLLRKGRHFFCLVIKTQDLISRGNINPAK
jgi:hypothetical protein